METIRFKNIFGIRHIFSLLGTLLLTIALVSCGSPAVEESPSAESEPVEEVSASAEIAEIPAEPTSTSVPEPTAEPTADPNLIAPGNYLVGVDLEPGIYTGKTGVGLLDSCYWERLSDLSGDFSAILSNDNAEGLFYIEVLASDKAFKIDCAINKYDEATAQHSILTTVETGTYLVGKDIEPGVYKGQAGTDTLDSCYWERSSGLTGDLNEIIANDNGVGPFYLEVGATDLALTTACALEKFDLNSPAVNTYPTNIGPGTYIVGLDIQPGMYKGEAGADIMDSCYWVRLSNLSGDFSGIIANENATGQFYVQVDGSDLALTTACSLEFAGQ